MSHVNKSHSGITFCMPSGLSDDSLSSGYCSREDSLLGGGGLFTGESGESCAEPPEVHDVPDERPTKQFFIPSRTIYQAETTRKDSRSVPTTTGRSREGSRLGQAPESDDDRKMRNDHQVWMERVNQAMAQRVLEMGREPKNLELLLLAASEIDKEDDGSTALESSSSARKAKRKGNYSKTGHTYKCRKVYGLYQKNKWCNQCRWKKACIMISPQL